LFATLLVARIAKRKTYRDRLGGWFGQGLLLCAVSFVTFAAVQAPSILRLVDSPIAGVFLPVQVWSYNLGILLSTLGLYLPPLAVMLFMRAGRSRAPFWLITPLVWLLLVSLIADWNTVWFWRATMCLHLVFGALCGTLLTSIAEVSRRRALWGGIAWAIVLLVGVLEHTLDLNRDHFVNHPVVARDRASILKWVYHHTSIDDKVVEFDLARQSLLPSTDYLRVGNQSGAQVLDRSLPLVGYQLYAARMSDIVHGIMANDYIVYGRNNPPFEQILRNCGAPVVYENQAYEVFHVDPDCRGRMQSADVQRAFVRYVQQGDSRWPTVALTAEETKEQQRFAAQDTEEGLRRYVEVNYWSRGEYTRAVSFVRPIVERHINWPQANYMLAFSGQGAGANLAAVIRHYSLALDKGFAEFWVRYNRGVAYAALGEKARAREDLERARELDPGHSGVRAALGSLGP
jgi:hypothetical protein